MDSQYINSVLRFNNLLLSEKINETFDFFSNNDKYVIKFNYKEDRFEVIINNIIYDEVLIFSLNKYYLEIQIDEFMYDVSSDGIDNILLLLNEIVNKSYTIFDYFKDETYLFSEIVCVNNKLNQFSPDFSHMKMKTSTKKMIRYASKP